MDPESPIIPVSETPPAARVPMHLRYFALLRSNRNFRRLWMAQLVSELGDWFYSLAVYDLLLRLTGSGKAVGWAIILQLLPWFVMTPLAGALVDRFARRRLMIAADVVRAVVVLGLLLVHDRSQVWMVYVLLGTEVIFAAIFEPARNALLPNLCAKKEILPANALSSATWSFCLAVGAPLGGAVTALLGTHAAFFLNSLSFLTSAILIRRIRTEETHLQLAVGDSGDSPSGGGLRSVREGGRYLRQNPKCLVLSLAKTGLGLVGGVLLLLAVFGEQVFPIAGQGALSMGLLYGARGAGAGVGPLIGDHLSHGLETRMWKSISLSFFLLGMGYVAFSFAPNLPLAALAVFCAHMAGSNVWVMSTTLLQLNTEDPFRGRVFALDFGLNNLASAVSTYLVGTGLDNWGFSARHLAAALGVIVLLPGLLWLPAQARWARKNESSDA